MVSLLLGTLLILGPVLVATPAGAQPTDTETSDTTTTDTTPIDTATSDTAATADSEVPTDTETTRFLDLSINTITPSTAGTGNNRMSVTGTVSNVGDRTVTDISVRLQRGTRISAADQVRSTLFDDQATYDVVTPFVDISQSLAPGQSSTFTLTVALFDQTVTDGASLAIAETGIYPLLVNVNGTPDFGGPARLDDSRFLLPVTSTPSQSPTYLGRTPTTLLWPLAATSALVGGVPGSGDQVTLINDDLAGSLAAGGRLDGLVTSLSGALDSEAQQGGSTPLSDAVCLAIDPDLLVTVTNMVRGYRVLSDPNNPGSDTVAGTGAAAAASWLDRLRSLATDRCVLALPFGQTDVDRVIAVGNPDLIDSALQTPVDVVQNELSVQTRDVVWPTDGELDAAARTTLAASRPDAGLLLADTTTGPVEPENPIVSYDSVLSSTLADVGTRPMAPENAGSDVTTASVAARTQSAIGALNWHSFSSNPTEPLVIAPPQIWEPTATGAVAILATIADQFTSGRMVPRALDAAVDAAGAASPAADGSDELPSGDGATTGDGIGSGDNPTEAADTTVDRVGGLAARITDLRAALIDGSSTQPTPDEFVAPLWEDLVRALSTSAGSGDGSAADLRLNAVDGALDVIRESVSVVAPGGVFTLASEQSPMLLVARNDLPVPISVALRFDTPDGITLGDIGVQQLPARGSRSLQVPAQIDESRKLEVGVAVTTPSGTPLGEPSTVTVRSSSYGTAFTVITVVAGGLLLVLVARRLWRRFRGTPDPADRT